jgi:hypothetical protein
LCLFLPPTPPAAATADNTDQNEEQTMTIFEYLMKAIQDDARRAGERDRLLLEARRVRRARRQRLTPAAPARRRTEMRGNVTLDGVTQDPAGDEGLRAGGWAELGAAADALISRGDGTPPANVLVQEPMFLVPRASAGPPPGTRKGVR